MHTSSAVHIRIVFGQLRTFWNQLAWPDAETAYVFVSRILDDICKGKYFVTKFPFLNYRSVLLISKFATKLPFLADQDAKIDPNFKLMFYYWLTFKFGSFFTC